MMDAYIEKKEQKVNLKIAVTNLGELEELIEKINEEAEILRSTISQLRQFRVNIEFISSEKK